MTPLDANAELPDRRLRVAVVGSGISGLSCAWLLAQKHEVVLYERQERLGGHTNTVSVNDGGVELDVDTGFICFNERTYPNLIAMFEHLGVASQSTEMSFSVSLDEGAFEYAAPALFARRRNLVSLRFWSMLGEIVRFYRVARLKPPTSAEADLSLGAYLEKHRFGASLRDDHLLPMAAAIWSSPAESLLHYPAGSFLKFCANHGLTQLLDRPIWRTVTGGSRRYVEKLTKALGPGVRLARDVSEVRRTSAGVQVRDAMGGSQIFDQVVIATHADQALAMLAEPTAEEQRLLGAFRYSRNLAVLHTDESLMPKRRRAWASWNYIGSNDGLCVSYWMNRLQSLSGRDLFVTLNPPRAPKAGTLLRSELYEHPIFNAEAMSAQRELWSLQGQGGVWFCGAHFGAGFHEDGLQSGLAVAEQLGGVRRPWRVADESGRIVVGPPPATARAAA